MKRVLMVSAAALMVGFSAPAFADNDSTVDQVGIVNNATVGQSGAANANLSTIRTNGDNNATNVNQFGSNATNTSTITQGSAGFSSYDGSAAIIQAGSGVNESEVTQIDHGNTAQIDQGNIYGGASSNTSILSQSGSAAGLGNTATVNQGGDGNSNYSMITQSGSDNNVQTDQFGGSNINSSTVTQTGNSNQSTTSQSGVGMTNTSGITQTGNGNVASVTQQ